MLGYEYLRNISCTTRMFSDQYSCACALSSGRFSVGHTGFMHRSHSRNTLVDSSSLHRFYSGMASQNALRSSSVRSCSCPKPFIAGLRNSISRIR